MFSNLYQKLLNFVIAAIIVDVMLMNNILHCPVTEISGVWRFERETGCRTVSYSTPGHLLHYVVNGSGTLIINRRKYNIAAGTVIYYNETEEVRNYYHEDTSFYSIAFTAPDLPPLPLAQRVFKMEDDTGNIFSRLYATYTEKSPDTTLRLFNLLLELLTRLGFTESTLPSYTPHEKLWHQIETWIRQKRKFRVSIPNICRHFNISPATLHRVCRAASEKSVGKRIQQMRMEEARALIMFSGLNISETAQYLGYPRVHEFSREFSAYFKQTASSFKDF